jgi:multidrug efflux system membrane fusion protein
MNNRQEMLDQAQAALDQAQLEYDAAVRLQERDLRSASQVAQALAALKGTEQVIRSMELDIENTRITAPFDGVLQERAVEIGDFLGIGDPVARVIDLDPLVVEGQVTEFQVDKVKIGEVGQARLGNGRVVEGIIRYVAGEADPVSRTFMVELEIANPGSTIQAGLTTEVSIQTGSVLAHQIGPGLISISDDGIFGIKILEEDNTVRFIEADIVKFDTEVVWITNLPEKIRLITEGQGFTKDGDKVNVALMEAIGD